MVRGGTPASLSNAIKGDSCIIYLKITTVMNIRSFLPFLEWLPQYRRSDIRYDLLAGLTVAVMLIPQGMAYALLAGLPPVYGLYSGVVPLFIYAFLGTSRQLSVGPTALVSLLVLSGVSTLAEPQSPAFIRLAILTGFLAGAIQLLFGMLRLGFLINFLSQPVISGFTSAAAVIIALSQLQNLLGIDLERQNQIHLLISDLLPKIQDIHLPTFLLGLGGIALLVVQRRIRRSFPGALVLVVLGIAVVRIFQLPDFGVAVVGEVPRGLPALGSPSFVWSDIQRVFPVAMTICIISFIESLAIARFIQAQHKGQKIKPNQELTALGVSKLIGSFFQAFPTTGSFTRSAINDQAGARSGLASVFAAFFLVVTLLFLTPLFSDLPNALLGSIIVVSVFGLVDIKRFRYLWRSDRTDFLTMSATFLVTLLLGIQVGILTGIMLSLAFMLYRNSKPHLAVLGKLPDTRHYRNVNRFAEAEQHDEILVVRFDAQLYFGNATYFADTLEALIAQEGQELNLLVLDASNIHEVDSSGIEALRSVLEFLSERSVMLFIAGAIGPVRDAMLRHEMVEEIGEDHFFLSIADAIDAYRDQFGKQGLRSREALRSAWRNK